MKKKWRNALQLCLVALSIGTGLGVWIFAVLILMGLPMDYWVIVISALLGWAATCGLLHWIGREL